MSENIIKEVLVKRLIDVIESLTGSPAEIILTNRPENGSKIDKTTFLATLRIHKNPLYFSFSQESVYQIVDLLAGGSKSHWTNVENKPCSALEISIFDFLLSLVCESMSDVSYQNTKVKNMSKGYLGQITSGLECSHYLFKGEKFQSTITLITTKSALDTIDHFPSHVAQDLQIKNKILTCNSIKPCIHLPTATLVEWICGEIPQIGALIINIIPKEQASKILMDLPEVLAIDIAARYLLLGEVSEGIVKLVIQESEKIATNNARFHS